MSIRCCASCKVLMQPDDYSMDCSRCRQSITSDLAPQAQEQPQDEYCPWWLFPGMFALFLLAAGAYKLATGRMQWPW